MIEINFKEKEKKIEATLPIIKAGLEDKLIYEPFYKDFKYSFCWSSNAIEGNTLSLDETISLIEYDEVSAGHSFKEYTEAKRLYTAIEKYLCFTHGDITEEWIKDVASEITGLKRKYRDGNVYIGTLSEAVYYPPSYDKLEALMSDFIQNVEPDKKLSLGDKISYIAKKHIEFERIHPFLDGNGRTGRIILNQSLINQGLLPMVIEPKSKYRSAFKIYDKNQDTTLMENIIYNGQIASIEKVEKMLIKKEQMLGQPRDFDCELEI